jgi:CcmD family protein
MDNLGYLFAVFSIVWLVIFIFTYSMLSKQSKLKKEIQSLKEILAQKGLDKMDS